MSGPTPDRVEPEWVDAQRAAGWPDMHPEDYCHRCGNRNPLWGAEPADWQAATAAWAAETGREGICCPTCFAGMHREATGRNEIWMLVPYSEYQRAGFQERLKPGGDA